MKYIYKYEDSMRQCETLLTENIVKLCNYSMCLVQSPSISSSEFTERVKKYEIMKKKLNTAQENITTLKSEYNDLTLHCLKFTLSGINFKQEFFNYLARQETLRSKFIETINECKHINSCLDDILRDCSNEALSESSNQNTLKRGCLNTAVRFDLSSIPKVYVLLPKLDWDYGDSLTSDSHSLKPNSFSNEHDEELCTSAAAASASKSREVSSSDLNSDVAVKKCNLTTVLKNKKQLKNLLSSKRNEAPNLSQSLVCKICHQNISTKGSMKRHMFLHEGLKPFECANCSKSFARKRDVKSHIFSIHMPYQSRPYKCDTCRKFYSTWSHLNRHRCSATLKNHSTHISDRRQSLTCNICGGHFSLRSDLKRHMLIHEGVKPFKCAECGKSFRRKSHMNEHIRAYHSPYHTRPYKCDICGKRFVAQFHLNTHKRLAGHYRSSKLSKFTSADVDDGVTVEERDSTIVLGAKKVRKLVSSKRKKNSNPSQFFVCKVCSRNYSKPAYLERHMTSHEASKPFKCAECDKSFATKCTLKQHIILMHINDQRSLDPQYYYCAHCNYRGQFKESLVYHIKRHHISNLSLDEFSCTVCGKTFTQMGHRKIHERTVHVKEKCFCCTNCGKRYKYDRDLAQHLKREQCKTQVVHST
ncbi:gastrula zinc finger protein XlCGF57.1-like [Planococcus citri]|uniref:gastrula zinc finger protein XlCGF57.1-like n=1 Tax=Planococcus citri TaxID=170843 RepID=UPI0031F8F7AD